MVRLNCMLELSGKQFTLKIHKLLYKHWKQVLPQVLHSMRSLLCTTTNCTPYEHFLKFQRHTTHRNSLPSWLMNPGPVLLRRFIRTSKSNPLVDQFDLIDSNKSFASIRYPEWRESTVSFQDLAPYPGGTEIFSPQQTTSQQSSIEIPPEPASVGLTDMPNESTMSPESGHYTEDHDPLDRDIGPATRRSGHVSVPPKRYGWD